MHNVKCVVEKTISCLFSFQPIKWMKNLNRTVNVGYKSHLGIKMGILLLHQFRFFCCSLLWWGVFKLRYKKMQPNLVKVKEAVVTTQKWNMNNYKDWLKPCKSWQSQSYMYVMRQTFNIFDSFRLAKEKQQDLRELGIKLFSFKQKI